MTIWMLPIESIEERYSANWNAHFARALGSGVRSIPECPPKVTIKHGEFLDVAETLIFKGRQIGGAVDAIRKGAIKDGDVVLLHDLWHPGLESLFYARDAFKRRFKIVGLLHAGTYDPHDYLSRCGMARWAAAIERAWFQEVDMILVATEFHKRLLCDMRGTRRSKVRVTGFPLWISDVVERHAQWTKANIVVFPHRKAPEKQPELFGRVAKALRCLHPSWDFVFSKDEASTKEQYYDLLATSKIAVSCALQETWGIAMIESTLLGCLPVVPDRLSYVELYPKSCRYDSVDVGLESRYLIAAISKAIEMSDAKRSARAAGCAERLQFRLDYSIDWMRRAIQAIEP